MPVHRPGLAAKGIDERKLIEYLIAPWEWGDITIKPVQNAYFEATAMLVLGKRMSVLGKTPALTPAEMVRASVFLGTVAWIFAWANPWLVFLILWVPPLIILNALFLPWRTVAQHMGLSNPADVAASRRVDADFI